MLRFRRSAALLLLLSSTGAAAAQSPMLLSLDGPPVTIRYTPGALDRADHVQRRFELLVAETGRRQASRQLLVVELLEDSEWLRSRLAEPFGLPAVTAGGTLALPAWGTDATVALWRGLLDQRLPSVSGTPLRGSVEEAASLAAADLVGEVEGARLVLAGVGLAGAEPWIDDLLACALAVSAVQRYEPSRWPEVRRLFDSLARAAGAAGDERLRRLRYVVVAERIGEESGKLPARPLLKLARKQGGTLAAMTLIERYPWLRAWARAARDAN